MNDSQSSPLKDPNEPQNIQKTTPDCIIPKEFEEIVTKHVYRNAIAERIDWNVPLILVISGPPGVGKTFQTQKVLEKLGVSLHEMSGAEFENGEAGVPAKQLLERYDTASKDYDLNQKQPVILIDDADTVIGNWGPMVQYTVNSQMIYKTFIDIADHPKSVHTLRGKDYGAVTLEKKSVHRVPIIMTCNDSSKFYKPLMRPGRTTTFIWNPSTDTIKSIICGIFTSLSAGDCSTIVDNLTDYADKTDSHKYAYGVPISVYSDIKIILQDSILQNVVEKRFSLNDLREMGKEELENFIQNKTDYSAKTVIEIGKKLIQKDINYVKNDIEESA